MSDNPPRPVPTRRERIALIAASRQVPLQSIVVTIALVVAVYLGGKLLYRLRDIALLMLVGGLIALFLNPRSRRYSAGRCLAEGSPSGS